MLKSKRQKGFTLVELLIVIAIIGLLASILIPNLIDALQKSRQKRTMTDIRGVGTAWMSWMTDFNGAASAGASKRFDRSSYADVTYTALFSYLRPTDTFFYAQEVPQVDSWKHPYEFAMGTDGNSVVHVFVCSAARDGVFTECTDGEIVVDTFLSTDYDQDIIWADGYFLRSPDGLGSAVQ